MGKAILIMDMPTCCGKCPCANESAFDMCGVMERKTNFNSKPDWCPLLTEKQAIEILKEGA